MAGRRTASSSGQVEPATTVGRGSAWKGASQGSAGSAARARWAAESIPGSPVTTSARSGTPISARRAASSSAMAAARVSFAQVGARKSRARGERRPAPGGTVPATSATGIPRSTAWSTRTGQTSVLVKARTSGRRPSSARRLVPTRSHGR